MSSDSNVSKIRVDSQHARSWLLTNAAKPHSFGAALDCAADQIILDIEDAVAKEDKQYARDNVVAFVDDTHRAWVRINDAASDFWSADCQQLFELPGLCGVVLAKCESPSHVTDTAHRLPGVPIIPLIETA